MLNAPLGLYYYGLRGAFLMLLPKLKLRAERSNRLKYMVVKSPLCQQIKYLQFFIKYDKIIDE